VKSDQYYKQLWWYKCFCSFKVSIFNTSVHTGGKSVCPEPCERYRDRELLLLVPAWKLQFAQ